MTGPTPVLDRRRQRREVRDGGRRRRRGGTRRAPVAVQRVAATLQSGFGRARRAVVAAVSGDRPLIVALLVALGLGVVLLSGPTQNYLDSRARVEVLQAKAEALEDENGRLRDRAADLLDDETVELLAREQQGFVRPGEVPYALVLPEVDRPRITASRDEPEPTSAPWYERAWNRVQGLFGATYP